jgi:hypothetical protein
MRLALAIVARSGGGARLCPYQEINRHGLYGDLVPWRGMPSPSSTLP